MGRRVFGLFVAMALTAGTARAEGDADSGKKIFAKCMACHATEEGKNKIGPSLHDLVGRHSASIAGVAYSDAMKRLDKIWD